MVDPAPQAPTGTGAQEGPNGTGDPADAVLLAAHVAGDPEAFATLVSRHRDRLWAVALRTMRNPDDAADALQDAYISAFRRAETFRGDAAVTTWLHRIVVNACLDRLRRVRSRPSEPLPEDADRAGELAAATGTDPIEEKEQQSVVAAALATLNPDQRAALVLVDMQGYSVEEAAGMLGCAVGTVKSRCARGRARLLPLLANLRDLGGNDAEPAGPNARPSSARPGAQPPGAQPPAGPSAGPTRDRSTPRTGAT
jgi:RNA polymerase sigma-70 factor (ECF subfamily)